jgi:phage-related protein
MSTVSEFFTNLGLIIYGILTQITQVFNLVFYFFSVVSYLFKSFIYSIVYLVTMIGYFIKAFFEQFSLIWNLFYSIFEIITKGFEFILYIIGSIVSFINLFVSFTDNGGEDLF